LLAGPLSAQDFNNYKPIGCEGNIPKEYIISSTDKYKREIAVIEQSDLRRREAKDRKQFALETNFVLDDLLQSGMVLFNDEVSVYLNEVLAKLLEQNPKTNKEKPHVYALRSTSVNAFATDRGTIFVTLGLLAQLENEAQLAYILSHELVHAESGHSLELFLETKHLDKSSRNNDVLDESIFDENWVEKCAYSKELETEADDKGLDRLLKTKYSTASLNTVFDVLKYSYLPFDDEPFEHSFFEAEDYQFPTTYWLEKVKAISGEDENEDDKASTHPNIANRRAALNKTLKGTTDEGRSNYIVSEERFKKVRQITRFELPMLHLHRDEWPDAIYTSYLLLKQYPESNYLQKCIAKALYMQAKGEKNSFNNDNVASHSEIEGESQQIFHFLEKMPSKEMGILALRYAWGLQQKFPQDTELAIIVDDLFLELATDFKGLDEFSAKAIPTSEPVPAPAVDSIDNKDRSKYDKIREQKNKDAAPASQEYWRLAFASHLEDDAFTAAFEKGQAAAKKRKERDEYYESEEGKKWSREEDKRRERFGVSLGIDKIVVVNPYYMHLDIRKDKSMQYVKTEIGQDNMRNLIEAVVKETDLKVTVLDVCNLKEKQTDQFNDIRFLNDWFSEQVNHYDITLAPGYNQETVDAISKKYGTDYFLWTGTISLREKNRYLGYRILAALTLWQASPYFAYKSFKPKYEMMHYAILFDVRTGKRQVLKFDFFKEQDTDALIKSHLYDTFHQIKKIGKEEKTKKKK
jgi:beta-barrel assembly-enhancing protease